RGQLPRFRQQSPQNSCVSHAASFTIRHAESRNSENGSDKIPLEALRATPFQLSMVPTLRRLTSCSRSTCQICSLRFSRRPDTGAKIPRRQCVECASRPRLENFPPCV